MASPRIGSYPAIACTVMTASLFLAGCGNSSTSNMGGVQTTPVFNPDPNSPVQGVTLENESKYMDKIRPGTGKK
jgi:hypothetical protein